MKPFRPGAALAALAPLLLLASGCASNPLPTARQGIPDPGPAPLSAVPAQPLDPALLSPTEAAYRIGPGDQLRVQATGHLPAEADVTVGPDGKIYFEYLAGIDVSGMTLPEAGGRVAADLGKFEREKPHVALFLRRAVSQQVWMLGRLASPGVYALDRPTTLLGAVAGAGGLEVDTSGGGARSESADLSGSFLIRNGHVVPVDFERLLRDGDQSQNVYLEADDFVFIPSLRSSRIHVLGAVLQPRTERFGGQLTLVQAIALAGGTIPEACLPNVAILRGSLSHPRIAIVAVDQVLQGKAADMRLEAGDIVYVPFTPQRVLDRYANLILDTFARTVGVNEGAYAISRKSSPITVGVSVTP